MRTRQVAGVVTVADSLEFDFDDAELGRELTARLLDTVSARLQAARHRLVELYTYPDAAP